VGCWARDWVGRKTPAGPRTLTDTSVAPCNVHAPPANPHAPTPTPPPRSAMSGVAVSDALDLERTATEVAVAAARFAAAERRAAAAAGKPEDQAKLAAAEQAR
jgi:hypothetical protein